MACSMSKHTGRNRSKCNQCELELAGEKVWNADSGAAAVVAEAGLTSIKSKSHPDHKPA